MKRQKSILVLEDEIDLGEYVRDLLEPEYEEVIFCSTVHSAKELIEKRLFSLILIDIQMPEMPGQDFVAYLRSMGRLEPVIFVTGNASREVLLSAVQLGVCDVIEKPFEESRILESIDRTLEIDKRKLSLYENLFSSHPDETKGESQKRMIGLLQVASLKK